MKKLMTAVLLVVFGVGMAGMAGCETDAQTGALLGSLGGAAAGAAIGEGVSDEPGAGAAIGAAAGGAGGYMIGNESDKAKAREKDQYEY